MPVRRSPEVIDEIIRRVSEGEPLRAICRSEGMPHWTAVYQWMDDDKEFALRFARARELGADVIAQEAMDIVDTEPEKAETQFGSHRDAAHVAWLKNRAEMRLKLLAKWFPKRYGDTSKVELTGADGGPVEMTEPERVKRLKAALAGVRQAATSSTVDDLLD